VTGKLFWTDPYQTTLTTTVARVEGAQVWLQDTIFYAFSGGQESDAGTIAAGRSSRRKSRDRTLSTPCRRSMA
jgi:Ser-tRNA(Ala) deacylase AlaX